mgnify:CR=1 FL=1
MSDDVKKICKVLIRVAPNFLGPFLFTKGEAKCQKQS